MGEVYKATDTRLARTVAVKVLPAGLAADPEFRQRFDREAKAISQLTHPHICTLYDVGEHQGTAFLVMEHLEGSRSPPGWRKARSRSSRRCATRSRSRTRSTRRTARGSFIET